MSNQDHIIAHIEAKAAALRKRSHDADDWAAHCAAILTGVVDDIRAGLHRGEVA